MINWNEVVVGETEFCLAGFFNRKLLGVWGEFVWLQDGDAPGTYKKVNLEDWTIYYPWEEITERCEFVKSPKDGPYWMLYHKNSLLDWTIYDPWEEITEECEWVKVACYSDEHYWVLKYKDATVEHYDQNFKCDGRRVWKRKENLT